MNFFNWTKYTFSTLLRTIGAMIVSGIIGAIVGLIFALVYNAAASIMGGLKIELE